MSITLPATLEDFVAHQENLIRRKLTAGEREVTAAWLAIFNDVSTGDMDGITALENLGYLIDRTTGDDLLRFLRAARKWIEYAREVAQ